MSRNSSTSYSSEHQPPKALLRHEPFGGILFHPADATFLELDHEAFRLALSVYKEKRAPGFRHKRFFKSMRSLLPPQEFSVREIDHPSPSISPIPDVLSTPTLVDFQITEKCSMGCPHCYAQSQPEGSDASWEDVLLAINAMEHAGVCQVALGGGDPIRHPRFCEILALVRDRGMVPNLSTTGDGLTQGNVELS